MFTSVLFFERRWWFVGVALEGWLVYRFESSGRQKNESRIFEVSESPYGRIFT